MFNFDQIQLIILVSSFVFVMICEGRVTNARQDLCPEGTKINSYPNKFLPDEFFNKNAQNVIINDIRLVDGKLEKKIQQRVEANGSVEQGESEFNWGFTMENIAFRVETFLFNCFLLKMFVKIGVIWNSDLFFRFYASNLVGLKVKISTFLLKSGVSQQKTLLSKTFPS